MIACVRKIISFIFSGMYRHDWRLRYLPSTGSLVLFFGLVIILASISSIGDTYRVVSDVYVHDLFSSGVSLAPLRNSTPGDVLHCGSVFGCSATLCRAFRSWGPYTNLTFKPSPDGQHDGLCTTHHSRQNIDRIFRTSIILGGMAAACGASLCAISVMFWCTPALVHPTRITRKRLRVSTCIMGILGFASIVLHLGLFVYHWRLRQDAALDNAVTTPAPNTHVPLRGATHRTAYAESPHTLNNEWDIPLFWFYGNINLIVSNVIWTLVLVLFFIMTLVHYTYTFLLNQELISRSLNGEERLIKSTTTKFGALYDAALTTDDEFSAMVTDGRDESVSVLCDNTVASGELVIGKVDDEWSDVLVV